FPCGALVSDVLSTRFERDGPVRGRPVRASGWSERQSSSVMGASVSEGTALNRAAGWRAEPTPREGRWRTRGRGLLADRMAL
ncbi:MAG: hypothetical protein ACREM1_21645, partial [Longimicrobiales bacterium]